MREYKADRAVVIDVARYGAEQLLENRRGKKNHYHGVAVDKEGGRILGKKMRVYLYKFNVLNVVNFEDVQCGG